MKQIICTVFLLTWMTMTRFAEEERINLGTLKVLDALKSVE